MAIVASLVSATRSAGFSTAVAIAGGAILVAFGLWRLVSRRHVRWAGMRLSLTQIAAWSFLMSSAHDAGLMLLPVLAATPTAGSPHDHHLTAAGNGALTGLLAAALHTVVMLAVAATVTLIVYEAVGVGILRRRWFHLDRLWAALLVAAGLLTFAFAV